MTRLPPIEKVYEAWTAVVDNRVHMDGDRAQVQSSDGAKTYIVVIKGDECSSTDNATFWRGYPGYPVLAVLMLQGRLPFDASQAKQWADINWTALNKKHRNNYAAAVEEVERERGIDATEAAAEARKVMDALAALNITVKRKI